MATVKDFFAEWDSPDDFIVAHTSGSTGRPKAIRLQKSDMRASARATNSRFGIDSSSILALPLSVDFIAGKMMCVRAREAGCALIEMEVSNTVKIERHVDLLAVVPSQVDSLLEQSGIERMIANLIIGGAPLDIRRAEALRSRGFNAFVTYGMTETCSHVALAKVGDRIAIYQAMPGIRFRLDSRGCLVIVVHEYSFGELVTNDVVELVDDNSFIWKGRIDNVINSGGMKIIAEDLEQEIAGFMKRPFYIIGQKDDVWGEVPVMVFEGERNEECAMLELLRSRIDHRRCPKRTKAVTILRRTANGKVMRMDIL